MKTQLIIWWAIMAFALLFAAIGYIVNLKKEKGVANRNFDKKMWRGALGVIPTVGFLGTVIIVHFENIVQPTYQLWIWAFVVLSMLVYNIISYIRNGKILPSLSDSYYDGMGYWFTLLLFSQAIGVAILGFDLTEGKWFQFMVALACFFGLAFTGAAPLFKNKGIENTVHAIGAIMSAVFSQALVILWGYWYLTIVFAIIAAVIAWRYKNKIYWLEMAAFAATYMAIGFLIIS